MNQPVTLCKVKLFSYGAEFNSSQLDARRDEAIAELKTMISSFALLKQDQIKTAYEIDHQDVMLVIKLAESNQTEFAEFGGHESLIDIKKRVINEIKDTPARLGALVFDNLYGDDGVFDERALELLSLIKKRRKTEIRLNVDGRNMCLPFPEFPDLIFDPTTRIITCKIKSLEQSFAQIRNVWDERQTIISSMSREVKLNTINHALDNLFINHFASAVVHRTKLNLEVTAHLDSISRNVVQYDLIRVLS